MEATPKPSSGSLSCQQAGAVLLTQFSGPSPLRLPHPVIKCCSQSKHTVTFGFQGFKSCVTGKDNKKIIEETNMRKLLSSIKFPKSSLFLALTHVF